MSWRTILSWEQPPEPLGGPELTLAQAKRQAFIDIITFAVSMGSIQDSVESFREDADYHVKDEDVEALDRWLQSEEFYTLADAVLGIVEPATHDMILREYDARVHG